MREKLNIKFAHLSALHKYRWRDSLCSMNSWERPIDVLFMAEFFYGTFPEFVELDEFFLLRLLEFSELYGAFSFLPYYTHTN